MKSGEQTAKSEKRSGHSGRGIFATEVTLQRYASFLDGRSGIFAALREYELPWEAPIHICAGLLKPEFCLPARGTRPAISATVCGSGASALQAKLSCLYEALERYSGIFRGDEPRRSARYSEIAQEAIHPDALTLFSETQYRNREEWNGREGRYNWVPQQFNAERSLDWSPAWSLTQQKVMYLPTAYCYFGYPFAPSHDFCRPDSNGNAAGDDVDQATVHGFLELVERECAAVWWYNRVRRPQVDIESFNSASITAIFNLYRAIGRSIDVLDITIDQAVPAFVAVSRSEESQRDDYTLGFGAHFDARIALTKAVTEMTQFLPAAVSDCNPACFLTLENARADMSFLMPDGEPPATVCSDFPSPAACDPKQQVLSCSELVKSWGLDMLVLNHTREDIGMSVVKVLVPGMRSWWARFAAGRLYTLPVQWRWLNRPYTEDHLNPCHLIL